MSDVTLSASVRQSLLSLQNTTGLVERTQNRLSTGLRVSAAIDDPVAFFQSKALSDRSSDFLEKKDGIDQGISTVTAALDGVAAIEDLVAQMKGIANSMKSATDAQIGDLVTQFNDLRSQVNNLAADATYQGTNLINGSGQTLTVEFSEKTASLLNVNSVDLSVGEQGLNLAANASTTSDTFVSFGTLNAAVSGNQFSSRFLSTTDDFTLTYNGSSKTFSAGETVSFTYGTGSSFSLVNSTAQALTLSNGGTVTVDIATDLSTVSGGKLGLLASTGTTTNLTLGFAASAVILASSQNTGTVAITYNGTSTITLTTAENLSFTFDVLGTKALTVTSATVLSAGEVITLGLKGSTSAFTGVGFYIAVTGADTVATAGAVTAADAATFGLALNGGATAAAITVGDLNVTGLVKAGDTTKINLVIDQLDNALTSLRTQSQKLGSNVALLNTRLSFTEQYTSTLQAGSDKLTLADINEEGANLLALQTRQQLGIQSLSLAAQAEASILSLFG